MNQDVVLITLLVQVLLPLAVGLVTRKSTNKNVKTVLLAVLTVVNTALVDYLAGTHDVKALCITAGLGLAVSLGAHYGVLKPSGATARVQDLLIHDKPEDPQEDISIDGAVEEQPETPEVVPGGIESQPEITDAQLEDLAALEEEESTKEQ